MSNSKTTREVSFFTRFLWFVAGADIEMLSLCPLDYKKYEAIGMTILMTSLVGFAAGSSAAWYFTEDTLWTLAFGLFWSLLIFSIDRSLVVTLKKDPYKKSYYVLPLVFRGFLAILVAGIMSIPLELLVFNGFIQNDIENYKSDLLKQQHDDSFDAQQAAEYDSKSESLNQLLKTESSKKDDIEMSINNKRSERQREVNMLNHPNTTTYNNAQASANGLQRQLNELYSLPNSDYRRNRIPGLRSQISHQRSVMSSEINAWNSKVNARISELDNEIAQLSDALRVAKETIARTDKEKQRVDSTSVSYQARAEESLNKTDERFRNGNNFTLYYAVLAHAIYKTHKVTHERMGTDGKTYTYETEEFVNKDFMFLLWFIRAMFFVIELLPSIVKVVSKAGQYELRVYHQEEELKKYLHSQEYQDYCYKMLHGDNQLEMDLQAQRHDAEKKVQHDIIQAIINAEESVAKDSIDNWEKLEKGKMLVRNSVL
ncbi:hypothetical protein CIK96_12645 [Prevotella sp. P4-98]|uniref:DUF4407 domain-containing protein n=1 Tax=Prevotella sp. P4-98 TaxID=2024219 RepID=UPI000B96F8FC|nr:DUF4407 domain-containing protein [Prevotella sp. P4-98]OYP43824.1 hypothetical protein CIK96_12645 [Prevotella sp. P4-98]